MRVRVRYFADAREAARRDGEDLDLAAGATVKDAVDALVRRHPALGSIAPRARVAVDERFVGPDEALAEDATLVLIPPVGGG
ncbi:MAG: MoaD/ThiS family protein [Planctomycetes bacterium]|nr:MoaD/ThiS family protein [Planctomycetota bacterium]MCB9829311.1 MoaD/ThiS family protein [Planctomycetota bacterium]MCB9902451.1 MoaD/ThiS family protein [Planctomycetota bacterium]